MEKLHHLGVGQANVLVQALVEHVRRGELALKCLVQIVVAHKLTVAAPYRA